MFTTKAGRHKALIKPKHEQEQVTGAGNSSREQEQVTGAGNRSG
jgi:hypothetical protein